MVAARCVAVSAPTQTLRNLPAEYEVAKLLHDAVCITFARFVVGFALRCAADLLDYRDK
jgi:hypothetical protein